MISIEYYINNPCSSLSIPYWKSKNITVPDTMKIVHENRFSEELLKEYEDETYFRLYHSMKELSKTKLEGYDIVTAVPEDIGTIVSVINYSYADLQVNKEQMQGYIKTPVYQPELWILINGSANGKCIGTAIVKELLWRGRGYAKFATVSGKVNNVTKPEVLYRKCGFTGDDVWHILHRK